MKGDKKKHLIMCLPYIFVWYLADKIGWLFRIAEGDRAGEKMVYAFLHFGEAFVGKLPSFHPLDVLAGVVRQIIIGSKIFLF